MARHDSFESASRTHLALILASILSISPPFFFFTGIAPNLIFIALVACFIITKALPSGGTCRSANSLIITLAAGTVFLATVAATFGGSAAHVKYSIYICLALLAIAATDTRDLESYSRALDSFVLIGLGCSIISVLLFFANPTSPIIEIQNPDGRASGLYYLTFSNWILGPIIRPAFIFDEPGTFSLIICLSVVIRESLGKDKSKSLQILAAGMITFGLAQLIICALYILLNFIYFLRKWRAKLVILVCFVASAITLLGTLYGEDLQFFSERLTWVEGEGLAGDNRSGQVQRFIEIATPQVVLFGMPDCLGANADCSEIGDLSSNPFTPISSFGLIFSFPFYLILFFLPIYAIGSRAPFAPIGLVLLLLQRPYLYTVGYALIIAIALYLIFSEQRHAKASN